MIGKASDPKETPIYGKWEDYSTKTLPTLDSCGGHFGVTPDSGGKVVYHYHVQPNPPFTIGCFGPDKDSAGTEILVTLDKCRTLCWSFLLMEWWIFLSLFAYSRSFTLRYTDEDCGTGILTVSTPTKSNFKYDDWCPCCKPLSLSSYLSPSLLSSVSRPLSLLSLSLFLFLFLTPTPTLTLTFPPPPPPPPPFPPPPPHRRPRQRVLKLLR